MLDNTTPQRSQITWMVLYATIHCSIRLKIAIPAIGYETYSQQHHSPKKSAHLDGPVGHHPLLHRVYDLVLHVLLHIPARVDDQLNLGGTALGVCELEETRRPGMLYCIPECGCQGTQFRVVWCVTYVWGVSKTNAEDIYICNKPTDKARSKNGRTNAASRCTVRNDGRLKGTVGTVLSEQRISARSLDLDH